MTVCLIIAGIVYAIINCATAYTMKAEEMKKHFVDHQCVVGKIAAGIFYAPAWMLKGIRVLILAAVK